MSIKIQNMQLEIEKLEHEMVTMGNHLNDLLSPNSSRKTVDFGIYTNKKYKGITAQKEILSHTNAIIFCDSNKKHLDAQQLWRGIEILPCGDLLEPWSPGGLHMVIFLYPSIIVGHLNVFCGL